MSIYVACRRRKTYRKRWSSPREFGRRYRDCQLAPPQCMFAENCILLRVRYIGLEPYVRRAELPERRVAAAPRPRRGCSAETTSPRPRRGCSAETTSPRPRRGYSAETTSPRPRRGYSAETGRRRGRDVDWSETVARPGYETRGRLASSSDVRWLIVPEPRALRDPDLRCALPPTDLPPNDVRLIACGGIPIPTPRRAVRDVSRAVPSGPRHRSASGRRRRRLFPALHEKASQSRRSETDAPPALRAGRRWLPPARARGRGGNRRRGVRRRPSRSRRRFRTAGYPPPLAPLVLSRDHGRCPGSRGWPPAAPRRDTFERAALVLGAA